MKNIRYVLLVLILLLTVNVKAAETCDSKEFSRVKELAKKVEFDYDYKVVDGIADFSIRAVNLHKDLKVLIIKDYFNDDYRQFTGDTEGTLSGFKSGERVTITIKAFVPNPCSGDTVYTKTVKLPYYNIFYDEKLCKGNEDFKYCKLLLDKNITEKEFNSQYEQYLISRGKKSDNNEIIDNNNDNTNLYLIIGGTVLVVIIGGYLVANIIKRREKNKL